MYVCIQSGSTSPHTDHIHLLDTAHSHLVFIYLYFLAHLILHLESTEKINNVLFENVK